MSEEHVLGLYKNMCSLDVFTMSYNPLTILDINFYTEMQKGQIHVNGIALLRFKSPDVLCLYEINISWIMSTY